MRNRRGRKFAVQGSLAVLGSTLFAHWQALCCHMASLFFESNQVVTRQVMVSLVSIWQPLAAVQVLEFAKDGGFSEVHELWDSSRCGMWDCQGVQTTFKARRLS